MQGRRFAAFRFASAWETPEVNVSPHALAVQVGQTWLRAFRFASACETVDSNTSAPLPQFFLAVYVRGSGAETRGRGVETRLVARLVPVPEQSSSPAFRSASACETYEVTVCPHARAVHSRGGGGATTGQFQARALAAAAACETLDVKCRVWLPQVLLAV